MRHLHGQTLHCAFLLRPGFDLLSLAGALDVLRAANELLGERAYAPRLVGIDAVAVPSASGAALAVEASLTTVGPVGALYVMAEDLPGERETPDALLHSLGSALSAAGGVLGGCGNGGAWLALARLMEGYRWTAHWAQREAISERFPNSLVSNHLYEVDRTRLTCAGHGASIDLFLAWMALRHGEPLALQLAPQFGLDRLRAVQERQRAPATARLGGSCKLADAIALMENNLSEPLSTEDIAGLVGVSRRQLERLFKQHLDALPSRWYLELRLARAQRLLRQSSQSILQIGLACGFASGAHFSTAYRTYFGRTPRDERSTRLASWRQPEPASVPIPTTETP